MLMKWEDLSPGDVVKINDEIGKKYIDNQRHESFVKEFCFKELIVKEIVIYDKEIKVKICNSDGKLFPVFMNRETYKEIWSLFPEGITPIEILRLEGNDEALPEYS